MTKYLLALFITCLNVQITFADSNNKIVQSTKSTETKTKNMQKSDHKTIERGQLLSSELVARISKDDINAYFPERKKMKGDIEEVPQYDIDLYKITYGSVYKGKLTELSGLIIVPQKNSSYTLLQYHHGTLLPYPAKDGWGNQDAPSLYEGNSPKAHKEQYETRLYGNYLGSHGYLVSLPDYAGYGVSANIEHPYYVVNSELAQESVDMILATKAFAEKNHLPLNEKVALSGWSEGGAVAVATQKLIEEKYQNSIKLLANAPMSGLLNIAGGLQQIFISTPQMNNNLGDGMDFLAWLYYSYNQFASKPIDFDYIFKMPVSNAFDVLKNRPSDVPSEVLKVLDKHSLKHMLKQARVNDLVTGWKPIAPLFIHHGTADRIVPFANNADVALKNFTNKGGNVTLTPYERHGHVSLGLLQLKNMIAEFEKLEKNQ